MTNSTGFFGNLKNEISQKHPLELMYFIALQVMYNTFRPWLYAIAYRFFARRGLSNAMLTRSPPDVAMEEKDNIVVS